MKSINIKDAQAQLFQLISEVNDDFDPIMIINDQGKNAVLLSEEVWKKIEETLDIKDVPGYVENLKDIRDTKDWDKAKEYQKDEEW